MKIEINFEKLKEVVNQALNSVMKTGQNPALRGIYFEASANSLTVRSTNVGIGFESSLSCNIVSPGKFLILGDVIGRLMSSVNPKSEDLCILTYETGVLKFQVGKHDFTLKTISAENFPTLPSVSGVDIFVDKNIFLDGLKSVVFCAAKSEIKPEISGVYVKFLGQEMYFVATDAYRLAEKKVTLDEEVPEISFILPEKNIKELLRILEVGKDGKLILTISKNSLQIKNDNVYVVSRLIEGNFPNYNQIIPSSPVSFSIYLKEDLIKSLRLTSFFSDKTQQVMLLVNPENSEIEASNQEIGNTKESLSSTLKGEAFSVKLNSKYLEEFLQSTKDQSVVLKFTAQNKAIIVQGIQDSNYTYLIMPSYR
jgi:DNA polymerase-3 subunit beta